MYRSSSSTRVSDEYFAHTATSPGLLPSPPSSIHQNNNNNNNHVFVDQQQVLPTHVAKKEKGRIRSAENVIHLIPLLLILCTIILWFFSSPVDVVRKGGDPLVAAGVASSVDNSGARGMGSSLSEVIKEEERFDTSDESANPANDRSN